MKKWIKKLILWVNNNPGVSFLIGLTSCIPLAIISFVHGWKVIKLFFSALSMTAIVIWLVIFLLLIFDWLQIQWKKFVEWASR